MRNHPPAGPLRSAHLALRDRHPQLRPRDAARALGVSEAELVAADVGHGVTRLQPDWPALLQALPTLGRLRCRTRNQACEHERSGHYRHVETNGGMGLVLGPEINLRLFLRNWAFGFACTRPQWPGSQPSLQFFDARGQAIQTIDLTGDSDEIRYNGLVNRHAAEHQHAELRLRLGTATAPARPDDAIDVDGLRAGWRGLRDTQDFSGLLQHYGVTREQALRLVGAPLAVPVGNAAACRLLETVSSLGEEICVQVGNRGCLQIHSGPARRIARCGPWLKVLDSSFNLHLREDQVASSWIVRKPGADGIVHTLELYDNAANLTVQILGHRSRGQAERGSWRDILGQIETQLAH